jgi:large subunit ribosomal protein L18
MSKVILRKSNLTRRKLRVRKKISGTKERPRLSVFRSNKYCYAQLIDDENQKTLVGVSLNAIKDSHQGKDKKSGAYEVGKLLAQKAKEKKISRAVFDRSGYKYHGRVRQVAEGAREGGLKL